MSWQLRLRNFMTLREATSSDERDTPRDGKRTAYCHQQAAKCKLAATTAILSEIREAYLNIGQAWLQLAPEIDNRRTFSGKSFSDEQRG
jgi:hypothetical protein